MLDNPVATDAFAANAKQRLALFCWVTPQQPKEQEETVLLGVDVAKHVLQGLEQKQASNTPVAFADIVSVVAFERLLTLEDCTTLDRFTHEFFAKSGAGHSVSCGETRHRYHDITSIVAQGSRDRWRRVGSTELALREPEVCPQPPSCSAEMWTGIVLRMPLGAP